MEQQLDKQERRPDKNKRKHQPNECRADHQPPQRPAAEDRRFFPFPGAEQAVQVAPAAKEEKETKAVTDGKKEGKEKK